MKILFDQGTPVPLRRFIHPHVVDTAFELGWSKLQNGDLIAVAEEAGYQVLISTDQNLRYQQNLAGRTLAIIVLTSTSWPRIATRTDSILLALQNVAAGDYLEIKI